MTATFLVELEVNSTDPADLSLDADDLKDALEDAGFNATSVKPWARVGQANEALPLNLLPPSVG